MFFLKNIELSYRRETLLIGLGQIPAGRTIFDR